MEAREIYFVAACERKREAMPCAAIGLTSSGICLPGTLASIANHGSFQQGTLAWRVALCHSINEVHNLTRNSSRSILTTLAREQRLAERWPDSTGISLGVFARKPGAVTHLKRAEQESSTLRIRP